MRGDKIQTGLRIPEPLYTRLYQAAEQNGASVNAQILYLIDIGLKAIELGIQSEARELVRNRQDTSE